MRRFETIPIYHVIIPYIRNLTASLVLMVRVSNRRNPGSAELCSFLGTPRNTLLGFLHMLAEFCSVGCRIGILFSWWLSAGETTDVPHRPHRSQPEHWNRSTSDGPACLLFCFLFIFKLVYKVIVFFIANSHTHGLLLVLSIPYPPAFPFWSPSCPWIVLGSAFKSHLCYYAVLLVRHNSDSSVSLPGLLYFIGYICILIQIILWSLLINNLNFRIRKSPSQVC